MREFTQGDVDVLNEPSNVAAVELFVAGASALQRLGSADVTHAPRWRKDSAGGPAAARGATLSLPPAGPSAAGGGGNWRQASLSM